MINFVATSKRVREIIRDIQEGRLVPRPNFQRRKVWSNRDRVYLIDTILRGFPFPEIYWADGDVNTSTGEGTTLLVDGQQRVQSILDYFTGDESLKLPPDIPPYKSLMETQKLAFLEYVVAVRNLGSMTTEQMIDVFQRINVTSYSLNDMEINNAVYDGPLKQLAEKLAGHEFFDRRRIFRPLQIKRMGDVKFVLTVLITMMSGYFNRDDRIEEFLARYNDEFQKRDELEARFLTVADFVDDCEFSDKSRIWQQANLLCFMVEVEREMRTRGTPLDPRKTFEQVHAFFSLWDDVSTYSRSRAALLYDRASVQAANDRSNRVRRGTILRKVILGENVDMATLPDPSLSDPELPFE